MSALGRLRSFVIACYQPKAAISHRQRLAISQPRLRFSSKRSEPGPTRNSCCAIPVGSSARPLVMSSKHPAPLILSMLLSVRLANRPQSASRYLIHRRWTDAPPRSADPAQTIASQVRSPCLRRARRFRGPRGLSWIGRKLPSAAHISARIRRLAACPCLLIPILERF